MWAWGGGGVNLFIVQSTIIWPEKIGALAPPEIAPLVLWLLSALYRGNRLAYTAVGLDRWTYFRKVGFLSSDINYIYHFLITAYYGIKL